MKTTARIKLWGTVIGSVSWSDRDLGVFKYDSNFIEMGVEPSPVVMPLRRGVFDFPALSRETFKGLPGLLADSLPDKFGNLLIDRWLTEQGRLASDFNPVERLCYTGKRGMGALEFEPDIGTSEMFDDKVDISALTDLANRAVSDRLNLSGKIKGSNDKNALEQMLMVGTSAGGARAKAVIAWNQKTGEFRSGQLKTDKGFEYWLLKFDGIDKNSDKELADPLGFGREEYAFSLLAKEAGLSMMPCRLHEEGGRAHFMTKRFDRTDNGDKIHMQSLGAIRHFDFNQPRAHGYEQAIETIRILGMGDQAVEEQVLRAIFNVAIRNQDDHVKNIAFLMDREGEWSLAPAFDVGHAYNPNGLWTSEHQMSINGKTTNFLNEDLLEFGTRAGLKTGEINNIIDKITAALHKWPEFAERAGIPEERTNSLMIWFRWDCFGGVPEAIPSP